MNNRRHPRVKTVSPDDRGWKVYDITFPRLFPIVPAFQAFTRDRELYYVRKVYDKRPMNSKNVILFCLGLQLAVYKVPQIYSLKMNFVY